MPFKTLGGDATLRNRHDIISEKAATDEQSAAQYDRDASVLAHCGVFYYVY